MAAQNNQVYIMRRITVFALLISLLSTCPAASRTRNDEPDKMQWWNEAKFGMFVHWGPYSMYGGVYKGHQQRFGGAEWIFNRCKIPYLEYRENASHFHPDKFDADSLVLLAKRAGMKYLVFTTKHHDGFAMFRSDASEFNIIDYTSFGRDIVDEVASACKRHGIKLGFYYSQEQDWGNPGGATARRPISQGWAHPDSLLIDEYTKTHSGSWDGFQQIKSFEEYFNEISLPQIKELLDRYGEDISVIFFDYPVKTSKEQAAKVMDLLKEYPQIIINDRLQKPYYPGDYKTPENMVPKAEDVEGLYWESCMSIGNSWGYKSWDTKWKSPSNIVNTLISIASLGGNLLLNVGPDAQGIVRPEESGCLEEVGKWMEEYGSIIYGSSRSGLKPSWGRIIRKDEGKRTVLYLCVDKWPETGELDLEGRWKVRRAHILQNGKALAFKNVKGRVILEVPEVAPEVTLAGTPVIIRLELASKLPVGQLHTNAAKSLGNLGLDG